MQFHQLPMHQLAQQLQTQLERAGSAQLLVTGYSMVPMLRNGRDQVTLIPVVQPLKKSDVIFYQREDSQLVLHRIIRIQEQQLICSGDHQHTPEAVRPEQVLAVVSAFQRGGKTYHVTDRIYRLYAWIVTNAFPIRRPFLFLRKLAGSIKRTIR